MIPNEEIDRSEFSVLISSTKSFSNLLEKDNLCHEFHFDNNKEAVLVPNGSITKRFHNPDPSG